MRNDKKKEGWLFRFFYFLLLTFYFLLLISLAACGRRGDPVAVLPQEEKAAVTVQDRENGRESAPAGTAAETAGQESGEIKVAVPDPPAGLDALYTQKSIILTWDEVAGQGVAYYRIYRAEEAEGDVFTLVGDSMTPAFTDRNVRKNTTYFYRVTAFGSDEGLPSKEIEVFTGVH